MKTTIDNISPANVITFPVIAKSNAGVIVLFTDSTTGTVLVEHPHFTLGSHQTRWKSVYEKEWTIIDSITLTFTK